MPYYRQIKQYSHLGMKGLTESTVDGWFKQTVELLRPLYDALETEVMKTGYAQADETTTPVIDRDSHKAAKEYVWMIRAVVERLVLFHYDQGSRAGAVIERQCDDAKMTPDERKAKRDELSKPIMEAMKVWMETEGVKYSPSSLIGKAVTYAYTRWDNMARVLEDGRLLLDNNLAENEIRLITLGRKNYLFCGNHEAARNMTVICSLLATCRNHDVNPRDYLNDVISRMPYQVKATHEELVQLLPHKWKVQHSESIMTRTT